jgi:hypothetical protein
MTLYYKTIKIKAANIIYAVLVNFLPDLHETFTGLLQDLYETIKAPESVQRHTKDNMQGCRPNH